MSAVRSAVLLPGLDGTGLMLPVLYLRATEDRLMPKSAAGTVALIAPDTRIRDVEGPHFLFEVAPAFCRTACGARPAGQSC